MQITDFSEISLLITVYNRSSSLERLLNAFSELKVQLGEIIVSDDFSSDYHYTKMLEIQKRFDFQLIRPARNGGLANNINKGQRAVSRPYTLYVQEDFIPKPKFIETMTAALKIMKEDLPVDTIRFYSYFPYPYTQPYDHLFDEMVFKGSLLNWNHLKFYVYSDHPHLRRTSFNDKFGEYTEGIQSDKAEFEMCLSYIKNKGRGLLLKDFNSVFDQKNDPDEPSTIGRQSWREGNSIPLQTLRKVFLIYRFLKNHLQLSKKR